jgi:alkyl hydroperoxide reductase subunit F
MLEATMKTQLSTYLEMLRQPIRLIASLDGGASSAEMRELLVEIAGLSDKVSFEDSGSDARTPSFVIAREGETTGVRFAAIPLGHEFTSLVLALLWTGGHPPKVDAEVIEQIKGLDGEHRFEVYMSLSCHNCPDVVQAAALMAIVNPKIHTVVIDGGLFQEEVERRQVMAVPMMYRNDELFGSGRMLLEEIVGKLDVKSDEREAAKLDEKDPFDVLIVGGCPCAPQRFTRRARASASAWRPSVLVARPTTPWRSRTTSACWRPTARNSPPHSKPRCAITRWI